jgi:hypothetical protein
MSSHCFIVELIRITLFNRDCILGAFSNAGTKAVAQIVA